MKKFTVTAIIFALLMVLFSTNVFGDEEQDQKLPRVMYKYEAINIDGRLNIHRNNQWYEIDHQPNENEEIFFMVTVYVDKSILYNDDVTVLKLENLDMTVDNMKLSSNLLFQYFNKGE